MDPPEQTQDSLLQGQNNDHYSIMLRSVWGSPNTIVKKGIHRTLTPVIIQDVDALRQEIGASGSHTKAHSSGKSHGKTEKLVVVFSLWLYAYRKVLALCPKV